MWGGAAPSWCTPLLFLLTDVLFRFGGEGPRVVLSLLNVVLLFVPLVSVVFGTMYVYGAREFMELLLAQPVGRRSLFAGLYLGLALPLAGAFLLGVGLPFVIHARPEAALWGPLAMLLTAGVLLTFVFTAVAMLLATLFDDRAKGLGGAILIWLGCAVALRRADPALDHHVPGLSARAPRARAHAAQPDRPRAGAAPPAVRHARR